MLATFAEQDWNISGQVGVYVLYFLMLAGNDSLIMMLGVTFQRRLMVVLMAMLALPVYPTGMDCVTIAIHGQGFIAIEAHMQGFFTIDVHKQGFY